MKLYGYCFQLPHEKTDDRPRGLKQVDIGKDNLPPPVDPACWPYLPSIMVNNEALVPAVEVLMVPDLHLEFLQQRLVRPLAHRVHGGAHVIQDAHDPRRVLMGPKAKAPIQQLFPNTYNAYRGFPYGRKQQLPRSQIPSWKSFFPSEQEYHS